MKSKKPGDTLLCHGTRGLYVFEACEKILKNAHKLIEQEFLVDRNKLTILCSNKNRSIPDKRIIAS